MGFSQGGWVAQLAALDHPERVRSLALLSTRPTGHGPADPDLPEVSEALLAAWETPSADPDWDDAASVVDYLVEAERSLAGEEFDKAQARRIAQRCVGRSTQVQAAVVNHPLADQGEPWRLRLSEITRPCLVIHGSADPLFPVANAEALASEIPGARLEVLAGVGHELPPRIWGHVGKILVEHVRAAAGS